MIEIEVLRIIVRVPYSNIHDCVVRRYHPFAATHARRHIDQGKPAELRFGESWIRRKRIIASAAAWVSASWLNKLYVQKQSLTSAAQHVASELRPKVSSSQQVFEIHRRY